MGVTETWAVCCDPASAPVENGWRIPNWNVPETMSVTVAECAMLPDVPVTFTA